VDLILLLIGLLLILGTGFFVAVEFSLVALETATVQQAKDSGDKAADAVLRCLKTLSTQLSSCQIGITITTLLTGYTLDAAIKALTTGAISSLGLPTSVTDVLTLVLAMLIATLLSMVVGELLDRVVTMRDGSGNVTVRDVAIERDRGMDWKVTRLFVQLVVTVGRHQHGTV